MTLSLQDLLACQWGLCLVALSICTHLAQGGHQVATATLTQAINLGIAATAGAHVVVLKTSIQF